MKCQDRIFAETDIVIPITFDGVMTSDIGELSVSFVKKDEQSIFKTYLKSTGGVVIDGNQSLFWSEKRISRNQVSMTFK